MDKTIFAVFSSFLLSDGLRRMAEDSGAQTGGLGSQWKVAVAKGPAPEVGRVNIKNAAEGS